MCSARASLPGFQVLPLQQFGSWGPEITTKFDPEKDTYVMVGIPFLIWFLIVSLILLSAMLIQVIEYSATMECGHCRLLDGCRHR